jgi:hypothetical protein
MVETMFKSLTSTQSVKRDRQRVTLRFTSASIQEWAQSSLSTSIESLLRGVNEREQLVIVDYCDPNANKPLMSVTSEYSFRACVGFDCAKKGKQSDYPKRCV